MVAVRHHAFEESRGRHGVHPDVAVDLVHRLTDADHRGEVDHAVNPSRARSATSAIADVADEQPTSSGIDGASHAVHLLLEAVEDYDLVALVRADGRRDGIR